MTREILIKMIDNIKKHQRNPDQLFEHYVQRRLDKSLQTYYKQLLSSFSSLTTYDEENVLKQLIKTK